MCNCSVGVTVLIQTLLFKSVSCCGSKWSHFNFSSQIRETRQSLRDSESGLESLAIGHHIGTRAHIVERSQNRRTGDREERQDFINLDESESQMLDVYLEYRNLVF